MLRLLRYAFVAFALVAGIYYVYRLYLFEPGGESAEVFLRCPLEWTTGLKCPGCGSQRAVHHLMHGQISHAFYYNALAVMALPYFTFWIIPYTRKKFSWLYQSPKVTWAILALVLIFALWRNTSLYPLH